MRKCPSCGSAFRRGTKVLRITMDGAAKQVVCQNCAKFAARVLASDAPACCENCGKRPARVCLACVAGVLNDSATVSRALAAKLTSAKRAKPEEWTS